MTGKTEMADSFSLVLLQRYQSYASAVDGLRAGSTVCFTRHSLGHFRGSLHSQSLDWYWQTK